MKADIASLKAQLGDVAQLKAEMSAMRDEIANVTSLNRKMTTMEHEISVIPDKQRNSAVAFQVSVPRDQQLYTNMIVRFGVPLLNVGEGFQRATNTFVAPVSGLYVFFLKITSYRDHYLNVALKKNGLVIAEAESDDGQNYDRSSAQVVVQLATGDKVWAQQRFGDGHLIVAGHNAKSCRQKPECGKCKKGHLTTMHNEQRNPPVEPGDHGGEDEAVISAKCTSNVIEVKEMDNVGATVFERTKDDEKPGLSVEDKKFVTLMDANFTMDDDLMQNGKIRLHKIASSDREILQAFPKEDLSEDLQSLDLSDGSTVLPVHKCLGLDWNLNTDSFLINLQFVVSRKTRGGLANSKRWAVVFTCLAIRAVHIEVIEEMSSSSFINALARFTSLRGPVTEFRPIVPISHDPDSPFLLTPSVLLNQKTGNSQILCSPMDITDMYKSQWKHVQVMCSSSFATAEYHKLVVFMVSVPTNQDLSHQPRLNFGTPSLNVNGIAGPNIKIGLVKDGQVIAETETNDNDNNDRSSVQVVVKVSAGQSVWVEKKGGTVVVWISVSHLCDSRHLVKRSDDGDPLEPIVAQQGQAIDEMRAEITAMKAQIVIPVL
nr:hypothetical protein BaRGS_024580 [Batillaria attramentaria]